MPGPSAQMIGLFFGLHLRLAGRCCKNPLSARNPAQCKCGRGMTCLVSVTIYCTIFQLQLNSTSPAFMHKILRKKQLERMLIKQIIEFQLRGPGPPGRTYTPITG